MLDNIKEEYLKILKYELVPALGCTEPISIALAASYLFDLLKDAPDKIEAGISRNIIKNVKSVIVPNTDGLKGINAAISAGIISGEPHLELEVLQKLKSPDYENIKRYIERKTINIYPLETDRIFDIYLKGYLKDDIAEVRISDTHTNVVYLRLNDNIIIDKANDKINKDESSNLRYDLLNFDDIYDFIEKIDIKELKPLINRQFEFNYEISLEGLNNNYGANIGSVLMKGNSTSVKEKAKALAAAGSDARMGGCKKTVIILCGSGNQGITASMPILSYKKHYGISDDKAIRALALADLLAIHTKHDIGTLSAFCGVVVAGCASGAGIAYLLEEDKEIVKHTFVNAIAIISGIICDGAKPSCAAKIASSVDAGILGYEMAKSGEEFHKGEGIVAGSIEQNIKNITRLGRYGMATTDIEIMNIMLNRE